MCRPWTWGRPYLSVIGYFADFDLTMALSVDVEVDATPVILAALRILAPPTAKAN
ncbi:MAG: hypothetical protein P8Y05_09660 [Deinococcales bacterium]